MSIYIQIFVYYLFSFFILTLLYICVKCYNIYTASKGFVPFQKLISSKLMIVSVDVNTFFLFFFIFSSKKKFFIERKVLRDICCTPLGCCVYSAFSDQTAGL